MVKSSQFTSHGAVKMLPPPAKRTRRRIERIELKGTSEADKEMVDATLETKETSRGTAINTSKDPGTVNTVQDCRRSKQSKPATRQAKSTRRTISKQKDSNQNGVSSGNDSLPTSRKQKSTALNKQTGVVVVSLDLQTLRGEVCTKLGKNLFLIT